MSKKDILHLFNKYYGDRYEAYISSIKSEKKNHFFLVKDDHSKYLIVIGTHGICKDFEGDNLEEIKIDKYELVAKRCYLDHRNLNLLRGIFSCLNPSFCGQRPSFGTGDRLGIATPAHLQAFKNKDFFPILAQQSVREMARTERNWQMVLDDAIWGCFEAGW
ncbi:unnamed protein product [marine sediment metagenome]|uniref:Uncharacterized protein n=1 Tax=marine sediment metagenome TaxID=412755 RepID=X1DNV3_9ZZZZ